MFDVSFIETTCMGFVWQFQEQGKANVVLAHCIIVLFFSYRYKKT